MELRERKKKLHADVIPNVNTKALPCSSSEEAGDTVRTFPQAARSGGCACQCEVRIWSEDRGAREGTGPAWPRWWGEITAAVAGRKEGFPWIVPTRGRRLGTDGEEDTTQGRLQPGRDDEEHKHAFTSVFQNERDTSRVMRCPALLYHPLDKIWSVFIARGCMFTELSLPALQIDFQ